MDNETGNELATVTQPEQDPALGEGGNGAGAGPNAVALLPPVQLPPPSCASSGSTNLCCYPLHKTAPGSTRKCRKGTECQGHARGTKDPSTTLFDFLENPQNDLMDLNREPIDYHNIAFIKPPSMIAESP